MNGGRIDNVSSARDGAGGSSLSWNHVQGQLGKRGLITVWIAGEDTSSGQTNQRPTGVTYNGVAMTNRASKERADAHSVTGNVFELRGANIPAAAGTYAIVATFTGSCESRAGGCMSFKNVWDQNPEASADNSANGANPLQQNITTVTKNALVLAFYASQNANTPSFTTGETTGFTVGTGTGETMMVFAGYKIVPAISTQSTSISISNPEAEIMILLAYKVRPKRGGAALLKMMK